MYNLIECSDNYSKTSESLWHYYKDDPNDNITQSESFKSKIKITGKTPAAGNTKDVEIIVPLKYLSNFWRTLEMLLINCEVNLILHGHPPVFFLLQMEKQNLKQLKQNFMFRL